MLNTVLPSPATQQRYAHLPGLSALRGIAAFMIVIFHLPPVGQVLVPSFLAFTATHFWLGVPLFFVISAFSLYHSTFLRVGTDRWLRRYTLRRFFRIAPLFYTMILLWLVIHQILLGRSIGIGEILLNFTFTFGLIPGTHESLVWAGWTVGVEMLFYLLLPLALIFVRSLGRALLLYIGLVVISFWAFSFFSSLEGLPATYLRLNLLYQSPVFAVGIVVFFLFHKIAAIEDYKTRAKVAAAILIGAVIFGVIAVLGEASSQLSEHEVRHFVWPWAFGFLVVALALRPMVPIANSVLCFAGRLSFSIYLLHPVVIRSLRPLYHWIGEQLPNSLTSAYFLSALVTIVPLVVLAMLAYRFIEEPGIQVGSRLIARWPRSKSAFAVD